MQKSLFPPFSDTQYLFQFILIFFRYLLYKHRPTYIYIGLDTHTHSPSISLEFSVSATASARARIHCRASGGDVWGRGLAHNRDTASHNMARARSEPHGRNEREWAELFISPERERQRERQAH